LAYSHTPANDRCALWITAHQAGATYIDGIAFKGYAGTSVGPVTQGAGQSGWTCYVAPGILTPEPGALTPEPTFKNVGAGICADQNGEYTPNLSANHVASSVCQSLCSHRGDCLAYSHTAINSRCALWITAPQTGIVHIDGIAFTGYAGTSAGPVAQGSGDPSWECYVKATHDSGAACGPLIGRQYWKDGSGTLISLGFINSNALACAAKCEETAANGDVCFYNSAVTASMQHHNCFLARDGVLDQTTYAGYLHLMARECTKPVRRLGQQIEDAPHTEIGSQILLV